MLGICCNTLQSLDGGYTFFNVHGHRSLAKIEQILKKK